MGEANKRKKVHNEGSSKLASSKQRGLTANKLKKFNKVNDNDFLSNDDLEAVNGLLSIIMRAHEETKYGAKKTAATSKKSLKKE